MERLYQIIANKDLAFIVFTKNNEKVYRVEWFFKTNFENNGFIYNLNYTQYKEVCSYIDANFIYLVKTKRSTKTFYTNSQNIDNYLKYN